MNKERKNDFKHSIEVGLSFGLTSGVITTLGLMVGVYTSTASKAAVLASLLTIAIADAMSDALGIHIAEENENIHTVTEIWVATITTFAAKFFISLSFVVAILLLPLKSAVLINICWGIFLMIGYNYWVGEKQEANTWSVILEHLVIAFLVIIITFLVGNWLNPWLGGMEF